MSRAREAPHPASSGSGSAGAASDSWRRRRRFLCLRPARKLIIGRGSSASRPWTRCSSCASAARPPCAAEPAPALDCRRSQACAASGQAGSAARDAERRVCRPRGFCMATQRGAAVRRVRLLGAGAGGSCRPAGCRQGPGAPCPGRPTCRLGRAPSPPPYRAAFPPCTPCPARDQGADGQEAGDDMQPPRQATLPDGSPNPEFFRRRARKGRWPAGRPGASPRQPRRCGA